jgi:hypothetical protein
MSREGSSVRCGSTSATAPYRTARMSITDRAAPICDAPEPEHMVRALIRDWRASSMLRTGLLSRIYLDTI